MKWLILLSLFGCTQVTSLNMRKHTFGLVPGKIIWFQVAGLESEHLAMLRFRQTADQATSFEKSMCVGKSWSFNLYNIRTSASQSFLAQMTGKKNIKGSCEDTSLKPMWNYLAAHGYQAGVFEVSPRKNESLLSYQECGETGKDFLDSLFYWQQGQVPAGAQTFYYNEDTAFKPDQRLYDRSCERGVCSSTITENLRGIYTKFQRGSNKNLFILRDFSYLQALERRDFIRAREILADLERAYSYAQSLTESNDYLVILTSGDSRFIDFPDQGKPWFEFERKGSNAQTKRTTLANMVLASGARAENFCGVYEDSDVFERVLSGPKQQGLELKLINPFK